MRKLTLLASSALILAASALPAAALDATPPALVQTDEYGTLIYSADFFAQYRPNTAADMVSRVPGFSVIDGSGDRGFEGNVGNVLINGARPASKNDTGSSVLSRTLASQVERIELVRGGSPGVEMQGYALVVNVILKTTSSREQVLTYNAALFDGGQDLFGGSYQFTQRSGERTWGIVLSDGISSSDSNGAGPLTRRAGDGTLLRDEAYYNDGYGGSNSIRGNWSGPALGGKLDLTSRYGISDWHNIDEQTAPGIFRQSLADSEERIGELGLTYSRPIATRLRSETRFIHEFSKFDNLAVSNSLIDDQARPETRFSSEGNTSETILRSLIRFERSATMEFEAGGEIAYNMLETDQVYSSGGTNIPLPSASVKVEETRGEVFGKGVWRATPQLTFEGSLRLEHSTISQSGDADHEERFFFAKPRLLTTWTPRENNQFRLRLERIVGQLDFSDFSASAQLSQENVMGGNVNLSPEQRWVAEVTYERRFWGEGIFSIGLRHDQISDVIDVIPLEDGLSAVGNIGDGTLNQLKINLTLPTDRFGIKGGKLGFENTWNDTEVTDPTTGQKRVISNIRPTQPVISFTHNIERLNAEWGVSWITRMGQNSYQPDQITGWTGSDYFQVYAEYRPMPSLTLRAQVNLWDDFHYQRTVFANRTDRNIAYVEDMMIDPRTFINIRLRKTF